TSAPVTEAGPPNVSPSRSTYSLLLYVAAAAGCPNYAHASMSDGARSDRIVEEPWLVPGVREIGAASLLSDLGHEVPTSLLPSFLTSTLGAPAAALGLIEGIADGAAGVARFAGGPLADDPERRRTTAVGGYVTTAVASSAIAAARRRGRSGCCAPSR